MIKIFLLFFSKRPGWLQIFDSAKLGRKTLGRIAGKLTGRRIAETSHAKPATQSTSSALDSQSKIRYTKNAWIFNVSYYKRKKNDAFSPDITSNKTIVQIFSWTE